MVIDEIGNAHIVARNVGRRIRAIELKEDSVSITFRDAPTYEVQITASSAHTVPDRDVGIRLSDQASYCCEYRHMSTDDNPDDLTGQFLVSIQLQEGPTVEDADGWDGSVDSMFLKIKTDQDEITIVNYNEHNGYYGGFDLVAKAV